MAYIMVTGGKKILVTQSVFERLVQAKQAGHAPTHLVDLGSDGYIEIGQIKQLYPNDSSTVAETEAWMKRKEERALWAREHAALQATYEFQSPHDKAARIIDTFGLLLWTARGNKTAPGQRIEGELRDRLMAALMLWLRENPDASHVPGAVYDKLIPFADRPETVHSRVSGVVSIGDGLTQIGV